MPGGSSRHAHPYPAALHEREVYDLAGLTHRSDRDVQYRAIRYTEGFVDCDAVAPARSGATRMTTRWPRR